MKRARNYRCLAAFRHQIRCFLAFSEAAARKAGIAPQQHQLLLVLKGLPNGVTPNIRLVANQMLLRHHTVVGLIDRLVTKGLIRRRKSAVDAREIVVVLTARGELLLERLSHEHEAELIRAAPTLITALRSIVKDFSHHQGMTDLGGPR